MPNPYGLNSIEDCVTCPVRAKGFFCDLPDQALKALKDKKFTVFYPEHAVLFVEGQEPRGVFVVCQGRVKMSINSREGKKVILFLSGPGDVLGLNAALSGHPYELTAETMQPTQVNYLPTDIFRRYLNSQPAASMQAAHLLSARCQTAYHQIKSLGLAQTAKEKLALLLREFAAHSRNAPGRTMNGDTRITLALTHEEIAQTIGASRETVTRLFSELKRQRILELRGSVLHIFDRAELERIASV